MNDLIQYKCKTCTKSFFLIEEELEHSIKEDKYITCPFNGKHKNIMVTNRYESIKEIKKIMEEGDVFKRHKGRIIKVR